MNSEERIKQQKELVEEIGRFYDKEGLQPIAGRILSLLMVMDKEEFTFEEITEELQISKSSASNTLKNLEIRGDIEYVTQPGDRKRYFRLKTHHPFSKIKETEKKLIEYKNMLMKIHELKATRDSKNSLYISSLIDMLDFFSEKLEGLKDEFENRK